MFCRRCGRYYLNLLDHLLEHVELTMTAFTDVQAVVDAAAADISASGDRIETAMTSLNGTVDLSSLQAAAAKIAAIVPAPDPTPSS